MIVTPALLEDRLALPGAQVFGSAKALDDDLTAIQES